MNINLTGDLCLAKLSYMLPMNRDFSRLHQQQFDVLICGGGIYGAWTAYDAALRGLKVCIVDKGDWAQATSSASSKLIHGGLRYLEKLDFTLVKKSLAERSMLLKVAPHRVWPLRFGVPLYPANRLGLFRLKLGLTLYDYLAGKIPNEQKHQSLSKAEFISHFPSLTNLPLTGGFTYLDAQTDDARFVLELIDGALAAGAECVNYCEVIELLEEHNSITGAVLRDAISQAIITLKATHVVDTSGRWSSNLQKSEVDSCLTKGIHLIMPKVLQEEALLLTAIDGRVFFIIPWYGRTLLGTTDTRYEGDMEDVPITHHDIQYLLTEANKVLKKTQWTEKDIIGQFAGIRVLQNSTSNPPSGLSRDWTLNISQQGLISSIGGKFTSAREDASAIVDYLCEKLGVNVACQTVDKAFPWLSNADYNTLLTSSLLEAQGLGIDRECAMTLIRRHGNRVPAIFRLCEDNKALTQKISPNLPFIMADLLFCAQQEMVIHLDDLLRRRIPLLILEKVNRDDLQKLAKIAGSILGWQDHETDAEIAKCQKMFEIADDQ